MILEHPFSLNQKCIGLTPEAYVKHWRDKDLADFRSAGIAFDYFSETSLFFQYQICSKCL